LKDYRQSQIQQNLMVRARIIHAVRQFFVLNDYMEVETPVRIPAPAPEAYIDAVSSESWFLQTSPELCMKRLLSAGFNRLFQICKCFREKERGSRHLPEFTMLEWYRAHSDYRDMMVTCEQLILYVARHIGVETVLTYQGDEVDLKPPWKRLTVKEAFDAYAEVPLEAALDQGRFDDTMALDIEPNLGKSSPVFLYDYPAQKGALARLKTEDPRYAERFELYIRGLELCNAFSELSDPVEQRDRFATEAEIREKTGRKAYSMPEPFLAALPDMPPSAGNALGLDRLVMLFCNVTAIDEVTAFVPEEL
jgi:elongation factor P--(R)-beta-lysine ligase